MFFLQSPAPKIAKQSSNQDSELLKCQNDNFWNLKNWFHVKSEWQHDTYKHILTLCGNKGNVLSHITLCYKIFEKNNKFYSLQILTQLTKFNVRNITRNIWKFGNLLHNYVIRTLNWPTFCKLKWWQLMSSWLPYMVKIWRNLLIIQSIWVLSEKKRIGMEPRKKNYYHMFR